MDQYQTYIAASRYARWLPEKERRESWPETVDRYIDYMLKQAKENTNISKEDFKELQEIMG